MRHPLRPSVVAALLSAAAAAFMASPGHASTVSVPRDHSLRLSVGGRAASVVLGNPSVADVTVVDSRTLYVTGKALGSTDVVVLDPLGRTVYASDIQVVNGAGSHVTVYRAGQRADMACNPTCVSPVELAANAPAASPLAGVASQPTPTSAVGALVGGAVGGAFGGAPTPR